LWAGAPPPSPWPSPVEGEGIEKGLRAAGCSCRMGQMDLERMLQPCIFDMG
jgi:hypothetical protein